jgi:alkylation response protein AidB-like acyl-CoA dehydrogenase
MNVLPAPEQVQFRESIARFISDHVDGLRRAPRSGLAGSADGLWKGLARLGCLGLGIAQTQGGHGGGAVEIGMVAEACGKGLVPEPFASTVVTASVIAAAASRTAREAWIPRVVDGECRLALAPLDDDSAPVIARPEGSAWRLDGVKRFVADAPVADAILVPAAIGADPQRQGLFLVERGARGCTETAFDTLDGRRAAHLRLGAVVLAADAHLDGADAASTLAAALDALAVAGCSEAVGCMQALLDRTIAYTRTRVQFGRPLSDNQVLRHRMVDMSIQLEEARATTLRAALHLGHSAPRRQRAVSSAMVKVSRAGTLVAEAAIQLHGAMGVTEELDVGSYARRLLRLRASHGTEREHRLRIAQLRAPDLDALASA